jgi:hypothetical protein
MYSAGAIFSAHLTGIADVIFEDVNFSKAALKSVGKNHILIMIYALNIWYFSLGFKRILQRENQNLQICLHSDLLTQ